MNIIEMLRKQATACPDVAAIIDTHRGRRRKMTFAGLEDAAARAAQLLRQAGLRPGDPVLVFQPMSAELYVALGAIFRLGLIAMFLDPAHGQDYIEHCIAVEQPKALIAGPKAHLLRLISGALRRIPYKFVIGPSLPGAVSWQRADRLPAYRHVEACSAETPALLTFTSGSTGQPKAALRTHGFLLAQHHALAQTLQPAAGRTDLTTMPIVALTNLASGVTCLIPKADLRYPGTIDPAPVVAQIRAEQVSSAVVSPALLARLARYCLQHKVTLPSLARVFTGGGPVFPRLLAQAQRIAPKAEVVAVYGSTEAEPIATLSYHHLKPDDTGAVLAGGGLPAGSPVEAIQLRIMCGRWGRPVGPYTEIAFAAACCPVGEAGEIVVSGEHVLPSYGHGSGDDLMKFRVDKNKWHRTGDAGYLDARGRLWLLGRGQARIEDDRGVLYPFAAEAAVMHHPQVRRAALISQAGQRLLAVEFHDALAPPNLVLLRESLGWAHIDQVKVFRKIPVDARHNAKIDYPALRKLLNSS